MAINLGTSFSSDHKFTSAKWLWKDEDSMGLPLITMFIAHYGMDAINWAPATIAMEIHDDFGVDCNRVVFDKLMCSIQLLTSNRFFVSLPDFCKICVSLAGEPDAYLPDAGDCAWGITEALLISPPDKDEPFVEEIRAYIGEALRLEGILNPPDVLRIALRDKGELLSQLSYDYSDDPDMFQVIASTEKQKTDNINQMVKIRMRKMLEQMSKLPLPKEFKANADRVVTKLLANLDKM